MNEILEKIKKYSTPLGERPTFKDDEINNDSEELLLKKFEEEVLKIGGRVVVCNNSGEASEELAKIISCYSSAAFNNTIDNSIIEKIKSLYPDKNIVKVKEIEEDLKMNLSKINVAVSVPECLIAESGTAVIRSSVDEPRLLSVLTEISVIFAKKEQIIPSMSSFLKKSKEKIDEFNKTSAYIFITGPSRTADIEKNLVIGVHGPGELIFVLY